MNDFHEPHFAREPGREPLDRLVEAFADLSVPEGPDQAVQLHLVAKLTSASIQLERAAQFVDPAGASTSSRPWKLAARIGSFAALAAALVGVVATALFMSNRREQSAASPAIDFAENVDVAPASSTSSASVRERLITAIDTQLRDRGSDALRRPDLAPLIDAVMKESHTASWRNAKERLAGALEQPEVIGVGVGLLGTLPWASYGRF